MSQRSRAFQTLNPPTSRTPTLRHRRATVLNTLLFKTDSLVRAKSPKRSSSGGINDSGRCPATRPVQETLRSPKENDDMCRVNIVCQSGMRVDPTGLQF